MSSNKSTAKKKRGALTPQRRPGMQRVADVLKAGAEVIAEKGYDGATMAEIAARAGSPIGSLYRFFPNKEILAEALMQQYANQIDEEFDKINSWVKTSSTDKLADAIIDFTSNLKKDTKVIMALLNARSDWSAKRVEFCNAAVTHIAKTLKLLAPKLPLQIAKDIAIILFHNMKMMKELKFQQNAPRSPGAMNELRQMNRLYLATKLAAFKSQPQR